MRIEYICHSALLIETKSHKILTDPWIRGSAYCDQWHLFPLPVNSGIAGTADTILISHGHEDHLHHESLLGLNKKATVYYPFQWQKGISEYLTADLGYAGVVEAVTYRSYKLSDGTVITYIANSLDSIIVIESDGQVILNINDALPANHINIIRKFTEAIKARWSRIDYLFCGYGSASYFPNTVHCEGKNDLETAQAREQMFAHNFCTIIEDLKPAHVIPFAADWVLLNDEKRWINNVRISKDHVREYYHSVFGGKSSEFTIMHSGDVLENGKLTKKSPYWERMRNTSDDALIEEQHAEAIRRVNELVYIDDAAASDLVAKLRGNMLERMKLFSADQLKQIRFSILLKDLRRDSYLNVDCTGTEPRIERADQPWQNSILRIETSSKILNYCLDSEWGGDAIIIGYGAEIHILDKAIIGKNLDIVCVRLLTRQPVASRQMKANPSRAAKYLLTNPLTTSWAVRQMVQGRNNVNKNPVNERDLWLNKSKCEICQVCDIPMLSNDFAEKLR